MDHKARKQKLTEEKQCHEGGADLLVVFLFVTDA